MNRKEFIKKLKLALSKLDMPYYMVKDLKFKYVYDCGFELELNFCLPHNSIVSLIMFCKINNITLAFDNGKSTLHSYKTFKRKKFYLPKKVE